MAPEFAEDSLVGSENLLPVEVQIFGDLIQDGVNRQDSFLLAEARYQEFPDHCIHLSGIVSDVPR